MSDPDAGHRVVRDDDPAVPDLLAAGWTVLAESWGARLRLASPPDLAGLHALVALARARGYDVRELAAAEVPAVAALEAATAPDYPRSPATDVPERTGAHLAELVGEGVRCFGAWADGDLVAVTAVRAPADAGERVETEFTSVAADHRRRGLAAAVKAASVVALAADGHRVFGTGGAAVNAGSLAMNDAVGYEVTERWLSLRAPRPDPQRVPRLV